MVNTMSRAEDGVYVHVPTDPGRQIPIVEQLLRSPNVRGPQRAVIEGDLKNLEEAHERWLTEHPAE